MKAIYKHIVKALAVTAAAISMAMMLEGSVSGRYLYYIKEDEERTRIAYTTETDPKAILTEAGRELGEYDIYRVEPRENDEDAFNLYVIEGVPCQVTVDGTTRTAVVEKGQTYAEAIKKLGITVGSEDIVSQNLSNVVTENGTLTIQRITYATRSATETIPYTTEYEPTRYLAEGKVKVFSSGKDGVKTVTYKDKLVDGVVVETTIDHEEITKAAVNAKAQIGDADAPVNYLAKPASLTLDGNGNPTSYEKVISGKATAYSARPGAYGSTGRYLHTGYVAVNPNIIPYGSRLYIKSKDGSYVYGYAIAADTGVALMDGRVLVDVYFNTYGEACAFGAKQVDVYVLSY